jgi:hypothetical protein
MKKLFHSFKRICFLAGMGLALATVGMLSGCATPASSERMTVSSNYREISKIPTSHSLKGNIGVAMVTGGGDTNPMWRSKVSSEAFQRALEDSLRNATLLNPTLSAGKYQLTADLLDLSQPLTGANLDVSTSVRYSLIDKSTRKEVYARVIQSAHSAKWNEAFNFNDRLNIANEGAIRTNIQMVIDDLFRLNLQ